MELFETGTEVQVREGTEWTRVGMIVRRDPNTRTYQVEFPDPNVTSDLVPRYTGKGETRIFKKENTRIPE
jgi:hypothetical protein